MNGLAEGNIAGDGQDENPSLGDDKRQPDFVVESRHNHSSAPQQFRQIFNDCIIPETRGPMQENYAVRTVKRVFIGMYGRSVFARLPSGGRGRHVRKNSSWPAIRCPADGMG